MSDLLTPSVPAGPDATAVAPSDGRRTSPLAELSEVVDLRVRVAAAVAGGVALAGVLIAWAFPGFLPPRALVGAAVGIAACLLALAAALVVDAADPLVRGPRHVRATGARTLAVIDGPPGPRTTVRLAGWASTLLDRGGNLKLGFAPAGPHAPTVDEWAEQVGIDLARRGRRVLVIDLTTAAAGSSRIGAAEVCTGSVSLGQAASFDEELTLARLGPGRTPGAALTGLAALTERLPRDVEVLVAALPALRQPGVLAAAAALDRVVLFAADGTTSRVDLLAGLDALDETGTTAGVVLLRHDALEHDEGLSDADSLVEASEPAVAPAAATVPELAPEPWPTTSVPTPEPWSVPSIEFGDPYADLEAEPEPGDAGIDPLEAAEPQPHVLDAAAVASPPEPDPDDTPPIARPAMVAPPADVEVFEEPVHETFEPELDGAAVDDRDGIDDHAAWRPQDLAPAATDWRASPDHDAMPSEADPIDVWRTDESPGAPSWAVHEDAWVEDPTVELPLDAPPAAEPAEPLRLLPVDDSVVAAPDEDEVDDIWATDDDDDERL